jgi:uncharacterized phiE125 gp8 family phage protein
MPLVQTFAPAVEPVTLAEAKNHLRLDADLTTDDTLVTMLIAAARRYAESYTGRSFVAQGWRLVADAFPGPSLFGVPPGVPYSLPGHAIQLEKGNTLAVSSITYLAMDTTWQTMPAANYTADLSGCPARITPVFGQIWPIPLPQIASVRVDYIAGYASRIVADPAADTIKPDLWPTLAVNDPVVLSNIGGVVPAGLAAGGTYYVQSIPSAGLYKLSATVGGAAIDITDAGTGTSFIGTVPEGIRQWIMLRLTTLYENREEVAILNRGKVEPLPFIDGLLDPYRVVLA